MVDIYGVVFEQRFQHFQFLMQHELETDHYLSTDVLTFKFKRSKHLLMLCMQ